MTLTYSALATRWGEEQLVHLPLDSIGSELLFSFDRLPPGGALPSEVPRLFTVHLAGEPGLFDEIRCEFADRGPYRFLVVGAAPGSPELLFGLDLVTGLVVLMDSVGQAVEPVSSSLAAFVEFLYRLAPLVDPDRPAPVADTVAELRAELRAHDPAAFDSPQSWWSMVLDQLARAHP
ncbi:MAG: SUKH-4 family immunity protein [Actinobacteria bacterium]|nr:SUKH-4 family immunity protein [Actinomycetota bacterium]